MAVSVTLNGVSHSLPQTSESGWGDNVTNYLVAIASACLQKSGGAFTLTSAVDFGGTAGLKALYWSTRGSNPASAGVVRLANAESVSWRNAANNADLALKVNSSNVLEFNGNPLVTLALGTANQVLKMNSGGTAYEWGALTNANVDAAAAIAYSKLALSGSIVNADISNSAAVAYSKLNLAGSIVNADISASAAIALSKLATVTASRVLVSDVSGNISASGVTATTLGYLDATSSVQTQLDGKQSLDSDLTAVAGLATTGLIARTGSGTAATRTVTGTANRITVTNGDGVSGNPTLDIGSDVVTLTGSQALTNKTITSPALGSPIISDYALVTETSAPSTPASGKLAVYAKTDHKLYTKDSNGTETQVGAGSSAGITFFFDDLENGSTSNWATYKDAAATTPADGTGGSPTVVTISASSSSPLRGIYSLAVAKSGSNGQGEGVAAAFTVPSGYQVGAKRRIAFLWDGTDSNYTAGDLTCYVYDVTNSTLITPSATSLPKAKMPVEISWDSSTSGSYRLIFHVAGTGTSAWTVKVDDVTVDPGKVVSGFANTGWTSYTLTIGGSTSAPTPGTTTVNEARWRRVGDSMEIYYSLRTTAAGSAGSGTYKFPLPSGYTADTSKIATIGAGSSGGLSILGPASGERSSTLYSGYAVLFDSTNIAIQLGDATQATSFVSSATFALDAAQKYSFRATVPIAEWAGASAWLGQNNVMYVSNDGSGGTAAGATYTTGMVAGPAGSQFVSVASTTGSSNTKYKVTWPQPVNSSSVVIEATQDGGVTWMKNGGSILNLGRLLQGTSEYGIWYEPIDSTSGYVVFGNKGRLSSNATYAGDGLTWTSIAGSATYKWVCKGEIAGAAIGFGAADANTLGLVRNGGSPTSLTHTDLTSQTNVTIGSGDVISMRWKTTDKVVTLWWYLDTISVSAASSFSFVLPSSVPRPTQTVWGSAMLYDNTTSFPSPVLIYMLTNGTMTVQKAASGNFSASTNASYFYGQMSWPTE